MLIYINVYVHIQIQVYSNIHTLYLYRVIKPVAVLLEMTDHSLNYAIYTRQEAAQAYLH